MSEFLIPAVYASLAFILLAWDRLDQGAALGSTPGVAAGVTFASLFAVGYAGASSYVQVAVGAVACCIGGLWVWRRRAPRGVGPSAQPGHVWWAWLPFEEKSGGKDRPVLIVRDDGGRHVYVRKITSQDPPAKVASQYTRVTWDTSKKKYSWCKTSGAASKVPRSNLRRAAGVAYQAR